MRHPKLGNLGVETNYEIRTCDAALSPAEYNRLPKNPIFIILDNLRSAFNVGAIFRSGDTARIQQIITCGYTAHPPHFKLEKTALGTIHFVSTQHFDKTQDAIRHLKNKIIPVFAVETTSKSMFYTKIMYPKPVGLIFGNEAIGIQRETLELCDKIIQIPMFGYKNSMNVASACAVVIFEILRQWTESPKQNGEK